MYRQSSCSVNDGAFILHPALRQVIGALEARLRTIKRTRCYCGLVISANAAGGKSGSLDLLSSRSHGQEATHTQTTGRKKDGP